MIVTYDHFTAAFDHMQTSGYISESDACILRRMAQPILNDPRFFECPASRSSKHHCFRGGLASHTCEVLLIATASAAQHMRLGDKVDFLVLAVAAIWHDYGKMEEYTLVEPLPPPGTKLVPERHIQKTEGCLVHHITRAAYRLGSLFYLANPKLIEAVLHAVEAHHGRRDWGSPHAPATLEAMILHHADMQSLMRDSGQNPNNSR